MPTKRNVSQSFHWTRIVRSTPLRLSTPAQHLLVASGGGLTEGLVRVWGGDFGERQSQLAGTALVTQEVTFSSLSHRGTPWSTRWESVFCQMQTLCFSCQRSCFSAYTGSSAGCSQPRCPQKSELKQMVHKTALKAHISAQLCEGEAYGSQGMEVPHRVPCLFGDILHVTLQPLPKFGTVTSDILARSQASHRVLPLLTLSKSLWMLFPVVSLRQPSGCHVSYKRNGGDIISQISKMLVSWERDEMWFWKNFWATLKMLVDEWGYCNASHLYILIPHHCL